ncbi:hypothetical protein KDC22_09170 [Paenibacillus tritici]|nr:hypothetical protein [Paenibacillus tritici]QUL56630.1 hypothetical protein KDC22_09170 [Paenibacillus tritici]
MTDEATANIGFLVLYMNAREPPERKLAMLKEAVQSGAKNYYFVPGSW